MARRPSRGPGVGGVLPRPARKLAGADVALERRTSESCQVPCCLSCPIVRLQKVFDALSRSGGTSKTKENAADVIALAERGIR